MPSEERKTTLAADFPCSSEWHGPKANPFVLSMKGLRAMGHSLPLSFNIQVLIAWLCPTLCDPMDCSPLGSSVHGIL